MILGAFLSSACGGIIAKFIGRKMSIWVAVVLCIVANVIMMASTSIGALYFARLLIGLANGMFLTFAQLYLQECAPAKYRGLVIGLFQSWTSMGTLVGTIIDNFTVKLGGRQSYIVPLAIIYIVPGIMAVGLLFIPESPRWCLLMGKTDQARKALHWLRPYPETIEDEIQEIVSAIEAERALAKSADALDMFRNPVDRRRTLLAVGAVSLQAASGAMYMICKSAWALDNSRTVTLTDPNSLWYILLRNGQGRLGIRKLVHPGRGGSRCNLDQQRNHHQVGSSTRVPYNRHDPLRNHAAYHRYCVRQARRQHRNWKGKFLFSTLIQETIMQTRSADFCRSLLGFLWSTLSAITAWWPHMPGFAVASSLHSDCEATLSDWRPRSAFWVPGWQHSPLLTSSTQIP